MAPPPSTPTDAPALEAPDGGYVPTSLALRTDLMFHRFEGEVRDLGDALVVRTPRVPTYWWGHVLIGKRPPSPDDVPAWLERYRTEVGDPSGVSSVAITWDEPERRDAAAIEPTLAAFAARGLEPVRLVGFAADPGTVAASGQPPAGLDLRPLASQHEWDALLELQMLERPEATTEASYREYRVRRHALTRDMVAAGWGTWFGAFDGARGPLVGSLGIFVERGLGRYQHVLTHPEHRGRGVASALLGAAARWAARRRGARRLIIVAEQDTAGHRLYAGRGFVEVERAAGASRPAHS